MKYLKTKFTIFSTCLIGIFFLNSCNLNKSTTSSSYEPGTLKTYNDTINKIKIKYPANWFLLENPTEFHGICFFPANRYKENKVVVTVFDKDSYIKKYGNPEMPGENTTLSNNPATKKIIIIKYTSDIYNTDLLDKDNYFLFMLLDLMNALNKLQDTFTDKSDKKILQIRSVKNDKIYIITYFSTERYFNDYTNAANEMINSFEIY